MPRSLARANRHAAKSEPFNFLERLKEIDMFFQGDAPVHHTMLKVVGDFQKLGIAYAVVGAMAVNAHKHRRTTDDVDFLLTPQGFAEFRRSLVPTSYTNVPTRPRRFVDPANGVTFDILVTGLFPGSGEPGPVAFPDPTAVNDTIENIQVVNLPTLIQLKLAARRYQDFGDVVSLVRVHNLDESFLPQLHPSLLNDFIECLEEKRREDEYEARQDKMFEEKVGKEDGQGETYSG